MSRETKEFTTPGGRKIVLNAYLTGREATQLKEVMYASLKISSADIQSGAINLTDIPASFLVEQERKALAFLLLSVDGAIDAPVDKLLDLPSSEYDAVVQEINKIQN